ncbi:MAG: mechanosensitive ion channel family protein [Spirochaetes bacterium]|nr:mechanosensitive ion channel family protein [Spirochaetota bacterium]
MAVSIFAGAGVMAVVIGFASQQAFSNIISGIFIAIFQPFRVGDIIKFGDKIGVVEDINLRHTVIRNFQNKRYIVPNSVISEETIENFHIGEEKTIKGVTIGISYDADIDQAMDIMRRVAEKHPFLLDARTEEEKKAGVHPVRVSVVGLGDFSVNLKYTSESI